MSREHASKHRLHKADRYLLSTHDESEPFNPTMPSYRPPHQPAPLGSNTQHARAAKASHLGILRCARSALQRIDTSCGGPIIPLGVSSARAKDPPPQRHRASCGRHMLAGRPAPAHCPGTQGRDTPGSAQGRGRNTRLFRSPPCHSSSALPAARRRRGCQATTSPPPDITPPSPDATEDLNADRHPTPTELRQVHDAIRHAFHAIHHHLVFQMRRNALEQTLNMAPTAIADSRPLHARSQSADATLCKAASRISRQRDPGPHRPEDARHRHRPADPRIWLLCRGLKSPPQHPSATPTHHILTSTGCFNDLPSPTTPASPSLP